MTHPHVFCRLESKTGIYVAREVELHMERQRPTLGYFELEEPIEKDSLVVLELGYLSRAFRLTALKINSCAQVAEKTFDVVATEAVKDVLSVSYVDQLKGVTLESALKQICRHLGITFKIQGTMPGTKPRNLIFLSTVRNALDQLWQVFGLSGERWMINLLSRELVFLPNGKFETEAIDIPMDYFKRETAGGLEMSIVPMLTPYVPVVWRQTERIIDISRMNSKTGTQFISFAEAA